MNLFSRISQSLKFMKPSIAADGRTLNYVRQVKLSLVMRLVTVVAGFSTTAILLRSISLENYGIWSLLISVQVWMSFFDLGIGNGLRTRVAESLAQAQPGEAARLITVAYLAFAAIFVVLMSALVPAVLLTDWQSLLNVTSIGSEELRVAVGVTGLLTCLVFVTNLINPVAAAVQRSSYSTVAGCASGTIFMVAALLMHISGWTSVLLILTVQGAVNILINIGFTLWFYAKRPELKPFPTLDLRGARDLISLGARFFVIQAAMLVLFSTDRVIIVQLLGPQQVPQYDVAFKLFSLFTIIHLMFAGPLLAAYTEAYHRSEHGWISRTIRGQVKIVLLLAAASGLLVFLAEPIVQIWTGGSVTLDPGLAIIMWFFAVLTMWNNVFGAVLNGIGRLRIQIFATVIGAVFNIPLSILFVKYLSFDVVGIVLATALCIAPQSILLPWAVFRILREQQEQGAQQRTA